MAVHILLVIVMIAAIQSMFGAGVSLLGTPLLLFFDYQFVDALVLLLPISLTINILQIVQHHAHINVAVYRKVVLLTLPPIAVFLFIVTHLRINIGLVIGPFLLLIALKEFSGTIARFLNRLMRYESLYFITVGLVHGLSNLGGSLLTAFIHHKDFPKDVARVTIAASYATFAVIQLLTLWLFSREQIHVPVHENMMYLIVAGMVFMFVDAVFYAAVERDHYRRIFAVFIAFSGLVLMAKALI